MADKLIDSEGRENLVYIKTDAGSYRDACFYQGGVRCGVCIPEGVAWQPVIMNGEIVSDKMLSLKKRGCEWSDTVRQQYTTWRKVSSFCTVSSGLCLSRGREEGESHETEEETGSRTPERLLSLKRTETSGDVEAYGISVLLASQIGVSSVILLSKVLDIPVKLSIAMQMKIADFIKLPYLCLKLNIRLASFRVMDPQEVDRLQARAKTVFE
ncbi:hypothetical protein LOD99_11861 [Oopsacas minuta]|uniref:Uncharacterized protein n=1 Tax=Oopsacas minuta TaxID=111878 RepID=A0AAV7JM24_9METZ|nr:hypothetical protein LOD99_11861 [Oopsacas minuta]